MEALEFKLQGKMAHFRKYYSNSTALCYYVPPITTIKGILAGLLGWERDSYYEEFANKNCVIGIAVDFPLKKITQTMNLLKAENVYDVMGMYDKKGNVIHTQNHTEWIIPENIRTGILSYTIVVVHKNSAIINALYKKIATLPEGYLSEGIALALGSAQCQGWITEGRMVTLSRCQATDENIPSRFAIPVEKIQKIEPYQNFFHIKKEESITEFSEKRCITQNSKKNIMISGNGMPALYQLKQGTVYWNYENENLILLGEENDNMGSL